MVGLVALIQVDASGSPAGAQGALGSLRLVTLSPLFFPSRFTKTQAVSSFTSEQVSSNFSPVSVLLSVFYMYTVRQNHLTGALGEHSRERGSTSSPLSSMPSADLTSILGSGARWVSSSFSPLLPPQVTPIGFLRNITQLRVFLSPSPRKNRTGRATKSSARKARTTFRAAGLWAAGTRTKRIAGEI
jgi:hypothetical protein